MSLYRYVTKGSFYLYDSLKDKLDGLYSRENFKVSWILTETGLKDGGLQKNIQTSNDIIAGNGRQRLSNESTFSVNMAAIPKK